MTTVQAVSRAATPGAAIGGLICHPTLPLLAGLDSGRPAVHVLDYGIGQPEFLDTIGTGATPDDEAEGWNRLSRTPMATWHPHDALLVVRGEEGVTQWTKDGTSTVEAISDEAEYAHVAFSPDGRHLWASPATGVTEGEAWDFCDVLDFASGKVATGYWWDTGVAVHPAGGLVATLRSDQGATLVLFGLLGDVSPALRLRDRAIILDADGYQSPIWSADGRYLAVTGNAYEKTLDVFAFPSLKRVLAETLGEPNPGFPYPAQWLQERRSWADQNLAFARGTNALWIGTPTGLLVEVDLEAGQVAQHDVLDGAVVRALASTPNGELVVSTDSGDVIFLSLDGDETTSSTDAPPGAGLTDFLDRTSELPPGSDLDEHLVITDGSATWDRESLESVTTTSDSDPTWLQLQAAINSAARPRN